LIQSVWIACPLPCAIKVHDVDNLLLILNPMSLIVNQGCAVFFTFPLWKWYLHQPNMALSSSK